MEDEGDASVDFSLMPEGCIASIISLTSPSDACRSSVVSSIFKSAAESDIVWQKFLPSDYQEIISRSSISPSPLIFSSKKKLYFFLCNQPILIDGGNKSFLLDKRTGRKIYMIGAKELSIVWGGAPQYWRWTSLPESRFREVAELIKVCWLEIKGKMETKMLSPKTTYAAYLVMKSVEGAYGFEHPPAEVFVNITSINDTTTTSTSTSSDDDHDENNNFRGGRSVYLDTTCALRRELGYQMAPQRVGLMMRYGRMLTPTTVQFPKSRGDGWMEVEMGEFYNDGGGEGEVSMALTEVKGGHWKAGLIIQGIELRPK